MPPSPWEKMTTGWGALPLAIPAPCEPQNTFVECKHTIISSILLVDGLSVLQELGMHRIWRCILHLILPLKESEECRASGVQYSKDANTCYGKFSTQHLKNEKDMMITKPRACINACDCYQDIVPGSYDLGSTPSTMQGTVAVNPTWWKGCFWVRPMR